MSRRAFTVLELLIATLIVALAMIPIISVFSSGARQAAFDEFHVAAQGYGLSLIERTIEQLNLAGFKPVQKKQEGESGGGFSPKTFSYVLTAGPIDGGGWLWLISVSLAWRLPTDPPGVGHSMVVERLVSRPDVCFTGKFPYRRQTEPE